MKKKTSPLKKITHFFDKHVVIPITRVVLKVSGTFDKSSHKLEALLSKQTTLVFLSLALALVLFFFVDQKKIVFNNTSAEVFKEQPVEILYNEERFVVSNAPEVADVTLMGSKADLYIAKQSMSNHSITIDLTDITEPGTYSVDLNYDISSLSSVDVNINPSKVNVVVELKESANKKLTHNVVNEDKLSSELDIDSVSLNVDQVVISGASSSVDKVASVEALVDVDKLDNQSVGTHEIKDITLVAYDAKGNIVDVEINRSETVVATVVISSSSKRVPLNFVIKENTSMPFGKAISAVSFSNSYVVAYGPKDVLDELETKGIDIELDASLLNNNYSGTVEIPLPTKVNKLSTNKVDVKVSVANSVTSNNYNMTLKLDAINTPNGFIAGAASSNDAEVLIKPTCAANICKALSAADLEAYVDLSDLAGKGEGTYTETVYVKAKTSTARLATYVISPSTVKIKLTKSK